jgi:hypothetical protein
MPIDLGDDRLVDHSNHEPRDSHRSANRESGRDHRGVRPAPTSAATAPPIRGQAGGRIGAPAAGIGEGVAISPPDFQILLPVLGPKSVAPCPRLRLSGSVADG